MRPETIERWAIECRLSTNERLALEFIGRRGEATVGEIEDYIYGGRIDGGPLNATKCVYQYVNSLKRKLGDRASIKPVTLYTLETHPGRREP